MLTQFIRQILFIIILTSPAWVFSDYDLRYSSIRSNMDVIFNYHIEQKSYNPLIVKRSFKIFIEQFDGEKGYLLKGEVKNYLELSDRDVELAIKNYSKDKFDQYLALTALFEKAVERNRKIRDQIKKELLAQESFLKEEIIESSDYSKTEVELKQKLKSRYIRILQIKERRSGERLSVEKKEKVLALLEKKIRRIESFYLKVDEKGGPLSQELSEHYTCLHILKAVTKSLDSHSSYYSREEAAELKAALKKQFHGIGIVLRENEDGVYVADLIANSPASLSKKVEIGDYLVGIDGINIQECSFDEVLSLLRGEEGSFVELKVKKPSHQTALVKVKREKIVLNEDRVSYTFEPYADGIIGKIILPGFYDNGEGVSAERDLREAIKELKSKGPIYGLVIDLRDNSGGFLTQAVKVAGLFISKGVIVISKYSDGEVRYMRDIDGRLYYQGPLVLLTSKASASAAEIVAQALQDYGVALVVGDERTYGKGSMQYQTVTEDNPSVYFKVTVGRYYTISGRSTQIEGVKADLVVPTIYSPYNIGEKYLEYPLSHDQLNLDQLGEKVDQKIMQKKYLPTLEIRQTPWRQMLPVLAENSKKRLSKNPDFQLFLKKIKGEEIKGKKGSAAEIDFVKLDLQMKEAVNIVKDMIILSPRYAKKS